MREEPAAELARFRKAQEESEDGFASALAEIRAGAKRGHWIWYVFPQLEGLGYSALSRRFAIRDLGEATAYASDPVLFARLLEISNAVDAQLKRGIALETLMGGPVDALKLVSSLTLFERAAELLEARGGRRAHAALAAVARQILSVAEAQGYPRCRHTLEQMRGFDPASAARSDDGTGS